MSYWQDKVVLVTGGADGLGRVIAESFAAAGAKVAIAALEPDRVEDAARQMAQCGYDVLGVQADITQQADVDRMLDCTLRQFGRLDVLVNNAGRSDRARVIDTTAEQFSRLMELNFLGAVRCTRAAIGELLKRRGHVVNIGSLAAKIASRWVGAYPASKFALAAYCQQLRLELGPEGLHVLLVCPGPIARKQPRLYPIDQTDDVPERARRPGAGVRLPLVQPERLAAAILRACQKRKAELVMPWRAKILFAIAALWPRLGDRIVLWVT